MEDCESRREEILDNSLKSTKINFLYRLLPSYVASLCLVIGSYAIYSSATNSISNRYRSLIEQHEQASKELEHLEKASISIDSLATLPYKNEELESLLEPIHKLNENINSRVNLIRVNTEKIRNSQEYKYYQKEMDKAKNVGSIIVSVGAMLWLFSCFYFGIGIHRTNRKRIKDLAELDEKYKNS